MSLDLVEKGLCMGNAVGCVVLTGMLISDRAEFECLGLGSKSGV
jgi:hypothetical protein